MGKITASNMAKFLDLSGKETIKLMGFGFVDETSFSKTWKQFFEITHVTRKEQKTILHDDKKEFSEDRVENYSELCMKWGKHHELNAIVTLIQALLEQYGNGNNTKKRDSIQYYETGFYTLQKKHINTSIMKEKGIDFHLLPSMGASPDGIIIVGDIQYLLEVKCPCPFQKPDKDNIVVYNAEKKPDLFPWPNYILQMMLQMLVTDIHQTYFVSWTPENGIAYSIIDFDEAFCADMLWLIQNLYQYFLMNEKNIKKTISIFDYEKIINIYVRFIMHLKEIRKNIKWFIYKNSIIL